MRQFREHAVSMQPSCSYSRPCNKHAQRSLCYWAATDCLQGCTRMRRVSRCWRSLVVTAIVLAAMMHPSVALTATADTQDRAFKVVGVLGRAGNLITEAVSDAASAIGTSRRRHAVERRTVRLASKEVHPTAASPTHLHKPSVASVPPIALNPC